MRKYSVLFAILFLSVSILTLTLGLYFNFSSAINGNKIAQFAFFNSALLVFVGIFFLIFNDKINVYLQNYRREKKI